MGFREVYLIGCDCDLSKGIHYDGSEETNAPYVDSWNNVFKLYEICKKIYEEDGRIIYNATVGGKLEVFERRKLEEII